MPVRTQMGKVGTTLESIRRAASTISYAPPNPVSVMSTLNNLDIADWQFVEGDSTLLLFGVDKWGNLNKKVAK